MGYKFQKAASALLLSSLAACASDSKTETSMSAALDGSDPLHTRVISGQLDGEDLGESVRYLNIPYAKPPIGELRWQAPQPIDPWQGVRAETAFPSPCPQGKSNQSPLSDNEDCLYLNVWRPTEQVQKAPVMVWIHGGGFRSGSAADIVPTTDDFAWYDGSVFAEEHGIVVVTFNYRLGSLGFFPHPDLADEGSPVGNQGMLDQRLVLQWVQDNIVAFGGDPENVTLFGESAGSASVCMHMVSPGSRDLFHRAISQSGGCTSRGIGSNEDKSENPALAMAKDLGCDGEDALECLRGKPVPEVVNLDESDRTTGLNRKLYSFGTVIDGEGGFLPKAPETYFDSGDFADIPYLIGSNHEEGMLYFFSAEVPMDAAGYTADLESRYGDFATRVEEVYPGSRFEDDYRKALARVVGDAGLVCGTHDTARRAAAAGRDVYMYNFNISWSIAAGALGPTHASEIGHVFGTPYMESNEHIATATAMNAYWANFAKTGDPNGDNVGVTWPKFIPDSNDDDTRIQFSATIDTVDSFRKEECALWREYAAK